MLGGGGITSHQTHIKVTLVCVHTHIIYIFFAKNERVWCFINDVRDHFYDIYMCLRHSPERGKKQETIGFITP